MNATFVRMRILLVEDEPSIAGFIREGLAEEGFAVDVADNGKQGWAMGVDNLAWPSSPSSSPRART